MVRQMNAIRSVKMIGTACYQRPPREKKAVRSRFHGTTVRRYSRTFVPGVGASAWYPRYLAIDAG